MPDSSYWINTGRDDVAVQNRLESGMGTQFTISQSIWRSCCVCFFFTAWLYASRRRTDSQYLVHHRACWSKRNHPAFLAYLKHLTGGGVLRNQHCVSLCPRTVNWLKSHSVRFTVASEYGFIVNWFCLRSCLGCVIYFLEYQIQHLRGVSVREVDANRGQCITVTQSLLISSSKNRSPCRSCFLLNG